MARLNKFIEMVINIILSWLRVERATIFLMSHSVVEFILAITRVIILIVKIVVVAVEYFSVCSNRINMKIPAVTKVDEWTRAEIGVGAAIASVNHAENGIWALLENAAINVVTNILFSILFVICVIIHDLVSIILIMVIISMMSPARFIIIV